MKLNKSKCKFEFVKGIPQPKLCDCGVVAPIGDGSKSGSFFLDPIHREWVCIGCGRVL